ncbi:hypothetical protein RhiirA4_458440 [Rhizophagus irregularis]|uniref:Serine-threonine/tyrosine-protein kinase catalytic domain-containing protein n=1 Tax=Rhizophagus irregularis TaxID=588596 RepID=A0A2I1GC66_9GLOM|nr:hypothetical protein RhiirA4_458440 [Rhizophagus irregularis]
MQSKLKRRVDDKELAYKYYGVTKLEGNITILQYICKYLFIDMSVSIDEEKYSLVLEYADCGTLGKYLRDDTMTFNWEKQLRFAKEIASAILCYIMLRESYMGSCE